MTMRGDTLLELNRRDAVLLKRGRELALAAARRSRLPHSEHAVLGDTVVYSTGAYPGEVVRFTLNRKGHTLKQLALPAPRR
jgi:hypothetical protein